MELQQLHLVHEFRIGMSYHEGVPWTLASEASPGSPLYCGASIAGAMSSARTVQPPWEDQRDGGVATCEQDSWADVRVASPAVLTPSVRHPTDQRCSWTRAARRVAAASSSESRANASRISSLAYRGNRWTWAWVTRPTSSADV